MHYIILGKNEKKGVSGNDSKELDQYFELGWELVSSRIDFIKLLKQKDLSNCTVVTCNDRKFFYTKLFDNVISYDDFKKINLAENDTVDDWPATRCSEGTDISFSFLNPKSFCSPDGRYIRHDEDFDEIFNGFDLTKSNVKKPNSYVVIGLRTRDHNAIKNYTNSINFYNLLIERIKKEVTENIFIIGYGTESFCDQHKCTYIDKLDDFVSLIKDKERCKLQIFQATGTSQLALICSESTVHVLDPLRYADFNGNNAVLGAKCIQFCKGEVIPHYELSESVIDKIISS